ncbi:MAG: polysaccharide deacetylase family protein [Clostridia bacterium]|nr:polysaccharide deacetylase family protein [Clostridia bacterium]
MVKKFLSLALVVMMFAGIIPFVAHADDAQPVNGVDYLFENFEDFDIADGKIGDVECTYQVGGTSTFSVADAPREGDADNKALKLDIPSDSTSKKTNLTVSKMNIPGNTYFGIDFCINRVDNSFNLCEIMYGTGSSAFLYFNVNSDKTGATLYLYKKYWSEADSKWNNWRYTTGKTITFGQWNSLQLITEPTNGTYSVWLNGEVAAEDWMYPISDFTEDHVTNFRWQFLQSGQMLIDNIDMKTYNGAEIISAIPQDASEPIGINDNIELTASGYITSVNLQLSDGLTSTTIEESAINQNGDVFIVEPGTLKPGTRYTLSGTITDMFGSTGNVKLVFRTESSDSPADWGNYYFDDFEDGDFTNGVWRSDAPVMKDGATIEVKTLKDASGNDTDAVELSCPSGSAIAQLTSKTTDGINITGDTWIEFDIYIDSMNEEGAVAMLDITTGGSSSNSLIYFMGGGQKLRCYFYNPETGKNEYNTVNYNWSMKTWYSVRVLVSPEKKTYSLWLGDTLISDELLIPIVTYKSETESVDGIRFQLINRPCTIYLDNIKVAKYLGFYDGEFTDGSKTIYNTYNGTNTFKALVVNNSDIDLEATLVMAAYSDSNELMKLYTANEQFAPNAVTPITATMTGVDSSWNIKVFFIDSLTTITPLRRSLGDVYNELKASVSTTEQTRTVEVLSSGYAGITPAYPGGKYKAFTVRYDDGYKADRTLINKLNSAGIKGTFYVSGKNIDASSSSISSEELKTLYLDNGHEIANHTYNHLKFGSQLADSEETVVFDPYVKEDIIRGKEFLEKSINAPVTGFTAPYTSYGSDPNSYVQYLKETGHTYAVIHEMRDGDFPLPDLHGTYGLFGVKSTTSQIRDYGVNDSGSNGIPDIIEEGGYIDRWLALSPTDMRLFFIWGHAHEFADTTSYYGYDAEEDGTYNNWQLADEICNRLGNRQDTWYATNGEIINYLVAHDEAVINYGSGSHRIFNPSQRVTLCFDLGDELIYVAPRETVVIELI